MRASPLDDAELLEYSAEHLRYEVWMLLGVVAFRKRLGPGVEHNAAIESFATESFAIHLRTLIEFLYPIDPRETDVIAADFFDDPDTWERIRPELSKSLQLARERAGREVAHLTTERIAGVNEKKVWEIAGLTEEVVSVLQVFCEQASPNKLHPSVQAEVDAATG